MVKTSAQFLVIWDRRQQRQLPLLVGSDLIWRDENLPNAMV
jgi:hypothetical protein